MSSTTYIIAFFGTGKTTYIAKHPEADAVDLVDAENNQGPNIGTFKRFATHSIVMADPNWQWVFDRAGVKYHIVIPGPDLKETYMLNYRERFRKGLGGGSEGFCKTISPIWDSTITRLTNSPNKISLTVLEKGQYLEDIINKLTNV